MIVVYIVGAVVLLFVIIFVKMFRNAQKVTKNVDIKTMNPIILNTGGIGAGSVDMNHANCACTLICDCEDENSIPLKIKIEFSIVTAYRFSNEMHCGGFADGSYDSIIEIKGSDWLKSICANAPSGLRELGRKRHFAMFIKSCGYYEFIADDVTVENEYQV